MSTSISTGTTSSSGSTSRITDLFSGLDTDTIVKNMCSGQQAKVDKANQQKTKYEWYEDALGDVVDAVGKFQNTYCSNLGSSSMLKASTYYTYKVETGSSSKAVTLSTVGSTVNNNYSVKVTQLAQNATITSTGMVSTDGSGISSNNTAALSELTFKNALKFDSKGEISFSINGKKFSFSQDTSLQSMINTINTDSDANVTMKYSRLTDSFTVTADSGGEDSSVNIVNISGNAFGANSAFRIGEETVKNGCNSIAEINGTTVMNDSNRYTIDGVTFQLNDVTAGTSEENIKFTLTRDTSATVDAISSFVNAFNDLVTSLNTQLNAKDYSADYPPLTDAQKEKMSDTQITEWNKKAKNGVMTKNEDLKTLVTSLKNAFFTTAGGTGKTATSIGFSSAPISVSSTYEGSLQGISYSASSGKLELDVNALTEALSKNPDEVTDLFTNGSIKSASADQGIIYKIRSAFTTYQSAVKDVEKKTDKNIKDTKDEIKEMNSKLDDMADRYYAKFSRMETALSKLNSESTYISQLFSNKS